MLLKSRKALALFLSATLIISLFVPVMASASEPAAEPNVIKNDSNGIPDTALYNAILDVLWKEPGQTFTKTEAATITKLSVRDVVSVKGISNLRNLEYLSFFENKLTSVEELGNLPKLKTLDLTGNKISSIKGLEKLKSLESLDLASNNLTSVEELQHLKKLESLDLSDNRLTSIGFLKQLTNLESLSLSNNKLTSIVGLGHLTKLTSLNVSGNKLKDVTEIQTLTNLESLFLHNCRLTTLPNLKACTLLRGWVTYGETNLLYSDFQNNAFTEKELKAKLPNQILKETNWLKRQLEKQYDPIDFSLVFGNPTGSGKPSMKDILLIQKYIAFMVPFTRGQILAADVNEDNIVNTKDILKLQKYVAKIITTLD